MYPLPADLEANDNQPLSIPPTTARTQAERQAEQASLRTMLFEGTNEDIVASYQRGRVNVTVRRFHMRTLGPGMWLSDPIIDMYLNDRPNMGRADTRAPDLCSRDPPDA